MTDCPFCARINRSEFAFGNDLAVALPDEYPVNPGHTLVIPRRHVADFFALTEDEKAAIWALVLPVKQGIEKRGSPDGYNIGINIGAAAGQTIGHAHLHVIPRYSGDVEDPRGGIRWVIPTKAPYWQEK
jgi:diadenosine tetraphosphate (Ap4A) HIT family hydrolase